MSCSKLIICVQQIVAVSLQRLAIVTDGGLGLGLLPACRPGVLCHIARISRTLWLKKNHVVAKNRPTALIWSLSCG